MKNEYFGRGRKLSVLGAQMISAFCFVSSMLFHLSLAASNETANSPTSAIKAPIKIGYVIPLSGNLQSQASALLMG